jgi:hypothetical protein
MHAYRSLHVLVAACIAVVLAVGSGAATPASAAALDEINKAIHFIQGETWADRPGATPVNIVPDLIACQVTLNVGHLSKHEESALEAGAGPRLSIVQRHDWAKPSRVLLILWIVFGGSGLIWLWRRYLRQA